MARKTVRKVSEECLQKMRELGYKEVSMRKYVRDFDLLAEFADGRGARHLSPELAQDYVDSLGDASARRIKEAWRACNLLEYFERTGEIAGRGAKADVTPPASTARYLELYIAECHRNNLAANTIRLKNQAICHFLWYLEDADAKFPDDVDAEVLEDWAAERADGTPGYTHSSVSAVRCFLRHLFTMGLIETNLAELVPKSGRYPNRPNTKMWTDEELGALIDSIPTSDSAGMRDRAICLLLVTYGMRGSDICALTLGDLDFDAQTIAYESPKTGAKVKLPMTDAVWESLAVWLRYGRPSGATCPSVFTTLRAPTTPLVTVRNVLRHRMGEAGVTRDPNGARSGPHSIRHTTATKLVSSGAPLPVVSSTLGQSVANTTMIYVHGSIDDLRRCALGEGVI